MLGYLKFRKATKQTVHEILLLLAPARLRGTIPTQALGDAYVFGFLQSYTVCIATESYGRAIEPALQCAVFLYAMQILVSPAFSKEIEAALPIVNDPAHAAHKNYAVGRHEGEAYALARLNDEHEARKLLSGFTDFIDRNYLKRD